jgi:hypothetical protein
MLKKTINIMIMILSFASLAWADTTIPMTNISDRCVLVNDSAGVHFYQTQDSQQANYFPYSTPRGMMFYPSINSAPQPLGAVLVPLEQTVLVPASLNGSFNLVTATEQGWLDSKAFVVSVGKAQGAEMYTFMEYLSVPGISRALPFFVSKANFNPQTCQPGNPSLVSFPQILK